MDPKQLFVVSAIAREDIAENLNGTLEAIPVDERIHANDARLTDEVCKKYAEDLGELDETIGDEWSTEYCWNLDVKTLRAMGVVLPGCVDETCESCGANGAKDYGSEKLCSLCASDAAEADGVR